MEFLFHTFLFDRKDNCLKQIKAVESKKSRMPNANWRVENLFQLSPVNEYNLIQHLKTRPKSNPEKNLKTNPHARNENNYAPDQPQMRKFAVSTDVLCSSSMRIKVDQYNQKREESYKGATIFQQL